MGPKMRAGMEVMADGKVYTSRELAAKGVNRRVVSRLRESGYVHEIGRGRFFLDEEYVTKRLSDHDTDDMLEDFARACIAGGDKSVICLYSAAQWHDFSIDMVPYIQVGVPHTRGALKGDRELLQFIRWRAEEAVDIGIERTVKFKGIEVRVTDKERTLVDLMRYCPLAGDRGGLLIDEESVTEAVASYFQSPESNPARLMAMAEQFGVREPFDIIIKNSQKNVGTVGAEEDWAPAFP